MKINPARIIKYTRYTARTILIFVSSFWFVFALLSGAEQYGGGIKGVMMNSPNALPWLVFFGVCFRGVEVGARRRKYYCFAWRTYILHVRRI